MAGDPSRVLLESSVWVWDREDDSGPKTWQTRWCSVTKTSGQTRLRIRLARGTSADEVPHEVPMENYAGLEMFPGTYEGRPHCFSLITFYHTYCIAVQSADTLRALHECFISELGHEWKFEVRVLATQNIVPAGDAIMRFYPRFFSLTNGSPPVCLGLWQHNHLRRYGGSQGFSFESGSRSIGGPEVYRLATHQGASIKSFFNCVAHGRPLPEPPMQMRRTYSTSSSATGMDAESDTWSTSPNSARAGSSSPFAFSNDTISLSNSTFYSTTEETSPSPTMASGQTQQQQQQPQQHSRGRDGEYDYVSVDVPRRPAAAVKDVNYLSVQIGPGGVPTTSQSSSSSGETTSPTAPSAAPTAQSTIYSDVDLQKTARLREAIVQSNRR